MGTEMLFAGIALGSSLALAAPPVRSQSRDATTGRAAFERALLDQSRVAFERVLADPFALPADLIDAHRYLAALHAAAGDPGRAESHTTAALALDPAAPPPPGASPALATVFARVQATRHGERARVSLELPVRATPGHLAHVRVSSHAVPASLAARVHLRCTADGLVVAQHVTDPPGDEGSLVPLDDAPRESLRCVATLTTAAGVILDRAEGQDLLAAPRSSVLPENPPAPTRTPPLVRYIALGAAGVAGTVLLTFLAVQLFASDASMAQVGPPRIVP